MPLTLTEAIAAAEQKFAFMTDDELAEQAAAAYWARSEARQALSDAEEAALNFRAIIGHAENWKRAVEHQQQRRAVERAAIEAHPCEVPGCTRTASAAKRTCTQHHVADIAAAQAA